MEVIKAPKDWQVWPVKGLIDAGPLKQEPPDFLGSVKYNKYGSIIWRDDTEMQVRGSCARYGVPYLRQTHHEILVKVQKIIGAKLYPTYFYDRFYFKNQELERHTDRPACEISVTVNISHNLSYDWPILFELPDGTVREFTCEPGDGVIYHGVTLPHWRDPMKGGKDSYFHQCFFHYVQADGPYLEYAFDNHNVVN